MAKTSTSFKKGESGNPEGRPKGSVNKVTKPLRESITAFLDENFDEVVKMWQGMSPGRDKLNFFRDLLKYAVPQLQSTELKTDFDALTDEQLDHIINELNSKMYETLRED